MNMVDENIFLCRYINMSIFRFEIAPIHKILNFCADVPVYWISLCRCGTG